MEVALIVLLSVGIPIAGLVALIVLPIWFRERTKQSAHNMISQALAKGEKIDAELLERITDPPARQQDRPRRTLGNAIIMIALSIGLVFASYFSGDFNPMEGRFDGPMLGAAILGALGIAFLILALVDYAAKSKTQPPQA
jgi:Mg2+/citrate symporter